MGDYELKAYVVGTDNYYEIAGDGVFNFSVFAKPGLPWWAILLIVVGSLGIVAVVFFILHQKGILQMLTGKVVIAMRARATIDATIAAVRANKVAAQAKVTVAQARAKDAAEARKKAMNTAKVKAAENTINGTKPAEKTQDENNNNKGEQQK